MGNEAVAGLAVGSEGERVRSETGFGLGKVTREAL